MDTVDAVVIGAGQAAGVVIAAHRRRGERVVLFEDGLLGGTCLNRGCRPTKAMRASARVAHLARRAAAHGISTGEVRVDLAAVVARKDAMIDRWRSAIEDWVDGEDGIDWRRVRGRLVPPDDGVPSGHHVVEGGDGRRVAAPRVYLNTGTRPVIPALPGLDTVPWLDNDTLHLDALPQELLVLGGNHVGLELGQLYGRLGSRVTLVEAGPRLAPREEPEVSAAITRVLTDEGVTVLTGARAARLEARGGGGVVLHLQDGRILTGSHLVLAVGRHPNTDDLGLSDVGVATDARGFVTTDEHLASSDPGILALGDINGRGAFTHTSYQHGEIAAGELGGGQRTVAGRIPTYGIFTDPPVGRVGMTEAEVRAAGTDALLATYDMARVTRAVLDGEPDGVMKVLVDRASGLFLGVSVMGPGCDEAVQVVSALMHAGATWRVLAEMLPVHPTVTEFWPTVLAGLRPLEPAPVPAARSAQTRTHRLTDPSRTAPQEATRTTPPPADVLR